MRSCRVTRRAPPALHVPRTTPAGSGGRAGQSPPASDARDRATAREPRARSGDRRGPREREWRGVRRGKAPRPTMIRPILRYGERPLHETAAEVTTFDDSLQRLIDDMIETMYAAPGVGLAATQVGVLLRVFVIDLSVGRNATDLIVMVNPSFVSREGTQLEEEGCLSAPGFHATVGRPRRPVVTGRDSQGEPLTIDG